MKNRSSKKIVVVIIVIVTILFSLFLYIRRDDVRNRFILRSLLGQIHSQYSQYINLSYVDLSEKEKHCKITYEVTALGWSSDYEKMNILKEIILSIDQYLRDHDTYLLNKKYRIEIVFRHKKLGEQVNFSNQTSVSNTEKGEFLFNSVEVLSMCSLSDLSNYKDVEKLKIANVKLDDYSILKEFKGIKYLEIILNHINDEELNVIQEIIPYCDIKVD